MVAEIGALAPTARWGRRPLRWLKRATAEPVSPRSLAEIAYAIVSLPIALVSFVFVVVSTFLGLGLSLTLIGLPLLALAGIGARRLTELQRSLAGALLNERVAPPPPPVERQGFLGWLQSRLRDPAAWRAVAYLVVKLPIAVALFYVTAVLYVEGLLAITYPIWWAISGPEHARPKGQPAELNIDGLVFRGSSGTSHPFKHSFTMQLGHFYFDSLPRALLVTLAGLIAVLLAPWLVRAVIRLDRFSIRRLLGTGNGAARVRALEAARATVAEDSAARLRRIERDLHDGTQAQLATLAMNLGQAKEKLEHRPEVPFDAEGALELLEGAHRQSKEALAELRNIARGIHPPALDVGLDAALATLVSRSAVPATLHADIAERPTQAIETIAYYTVAELLANAARHSRAHHVRVDAKVDHDCVWLRVDDDGIGGAVVGTGSGLVGLTDRVAAVDGRLELSSPPGGPTVVTVQLPLHA